MRADGAVGGLELNPDRTMDCVGSECGDSEFDQQRLSGLDALRVPRRALPATRRSSLCSTRPRPIPAWTGTHALSSVVQPLDPTLGKFFEDYTTARLTGNFTFAALAGVLPKTQGYDRRRLVERRTSRR